MNYLNIRFLMLGLLTFSEMTFADPPGSPIVEITSFLSAGSRTNAAELCGKVTDSKYDWTVVRIVADPQSNRPGIYNTLVGKDGKFCVVVVSYSGRAEASIGPGFGKDQRLESPMVKEVSLR
jgi:hypothetical protein